MIDIIKKIIIVVLIFLLGAFGFRYLATRRAIPKYVEASGTVEVQEVQLAPQASGRIEELFFEESQQIKKGDLLARLSMDGADDQLASAKAALDAAKAQLNELQNGFRKEQLLGAKAQMTAAKIQYEQALKDKERFEKLAREGAIPTRQAELAGEASDAKYEAYKAAQEQYKLYANGHRAEDIAAAKANVKRIAAEVERAKLAVSYKEFYAPADGVILTKNYEKGDVIAAGMPLATLGKLDECWVKLYIPSTQLALVKLGGSATLKVDAYADNFKGKVTKINQKAEYNPRLSLSQQERANMVFWIKVTVDNKDGMLKPGMPIDVKLDRE